MITVKTFTFNAYSENTYVLYDETLECVIIDPGMYEGYEQNELTAFIKQENLKPVLLLNTHCHLDHVFGNKFVFDTYGLKPKFHKGELQVLEAVPSYAPSMGFGKYEVSPLPDEFFPETGAVTFGDSILELIFAPGHSPAHLCFYSKADAALIGGDVLFYGSIGRTDLPGGDHQQLIQNISSKLFVLPDETKVYPGHGPATTIGFEKQHNPFF
ncbi:MBL fold metallo-hydrolase [Pedobacter sp. MC2016-05]|uniref:MBL fold metallo-hydrolase n=1 Tax=Pedobacter sp. MC2016-05 TaxID=2994474 RepID=UPI0022479ED4|nr:MBL fold metallo-hydrolase [Pedobacter sp. MC2016-05]MCX2475468.1 MBL fold metallo-hydrolase [Pedobacter sp. MC2016-05]